MGAALVWENQRQIEAAALVYAAQDDERLALKGMMRSRDGDAIREVAVVGSVWWFPSTTSTTTS